MLASPSSSALGAALRAEAALAAAAAPTTSSSSSSSRRLSTSAAFHIGRRAVRPCHPSDTIGSSTRSGRGHATSAPSRGKAASSSKLTRRYGQPLPHTHPHLFPVRSFDLAAGPSTSASLGTDEAQIAWDHLTPGIPASEYEERRKRLVERLPEGSVIVVMAGRQKSMSGNIYYRFRQESNFFYLTGFQEPDAALILEKNSSSRGYKMTMFVPPRDVANETWNGPRTGVDGAVEVFRADEALPMDSPALPTHLKAVLPSYTHIYADIPQHTAIPRSKASSMLNFLSPPSPSGLDIFSARKQDYDAIVKLLTDPKKCHPLSPHMDQLRVRKSDNELSVMRRAGSISGRAMASTMGFAAASQGRSEAQLQAHFEYRCALHGSQRPAYVPVVAGGTNALTIHYIANDEPLKKGDLVCMDAGGELDGYASDITRSFPVSGRFTEAQKELYQAVLNVLKDCTSQVTASHQLSLAELHRRSVKLLARELRAIGFDDVGHDALERVLYPHHLSHHLGIDLHDVRTVDRGARLEPGMVVTIEPGIYVPVGDKRFPKRFWGLGIRIEDDVAVGQDEPLVLSLEAPREIEDVEWACGRGGEI